MAEQLVLEHPHQAATHPHPPEHHGSGLLPAVQSMLYVLVVALFLITFTVQPIRIPTGSMEPTLLVGDFLLLDKQAAAPDDGPLMPPSGVSRGDIVVFHDPAGDPAVHLVKRVVALPGDRLHLRRGLVYLNGQRLHEDYAIYRPGPADLYRDDFPDLHTMDPAVRPAWWITLRSLIHDGDLTVPSGVYFVLGDNRNDSEDSRYWGFVPRAAIIGKPRLIYFSWRPPADDDPAAIPSPIKTAAHPNFARWDRLFRVVR